MGREPIPQWKGEDTTDRSAVSRLRDELFMQAVDRTVAFTREHSEELGLDPAQVNILAQKLVNGELKLPEDHLFSVQTMCEFVAVFNKVCKRYGPDRKKGKAVTRDTDGDKRREKRPQNPRPPPRGGPVICG